MGRAGTSPGLNQQAGDGGSRPRPEWWGVEGVETGPQPRAAGEGATQASDLPLPPAPPPSLLTGNLLLSYFSCNQTLTHKESVITITGSKKELHSAKKVAFYLRTDGQIKQLQITGQITFCRDSL